MNSTSIAFKAASLALSGGIFIVLFKKVQALKKYSFVSVLYVLLVALLLASPTLFNMMGLHYNEITLLISAQVFILILGIMHVVIASRALPWYRSQQFNNQLLFILVILFLGLLFSNLSLSDMQKQQLPLVWYLSLLWFLIPVLLNKTVDEVLKVPPKVFKLWFYSVDRSIEDPSDEELENPIVISFIFKKNIKSNGLTTFRAKAPVGMSLGRLFYFFINDYNARHPESTISFKKDTNEPYGWTFQKVRNNFLGLKEVIDPDSSIYSNDIRENDVLYCYRINLNDQTSSYETT